MEPEALTQQDKVKRGAQDSWQYFRYMVDFVGFTEEDVRAIRDDIHRMLEMVVKPVAGSPGSLSEY